MNNMTMNVLHLDIFELPVTMKTYNVGTLLTSLNVGSWDCMQIDLWKVKGKVVPVLLTEHHAMET